MFRFLALIVLVVFLIVCEQNADIDQREPNLKKETELAQKAPDLKKEKEKLLETDRLFSQASEKKGFAGAFDLFMSDEARVFQNNSQPIVGRDAIVKFMVENAVGTVTWNPYLVDMSASADLGYTLGTYKSAITDASGKKSLSHGHYVTIWKKQLDGSWKFVFDSGIQTPE
jgi:ketosteroid isomerase-like protein